MWASITVLLSIFSVALAVRCNNGCIGIPGCAPQGDPCHDNYCIYLREIAIQGGPYNTSTTKRTCSAVGSIIYNPNFPPYTLVNYCSSIVIDNVDYHIKICNNQDFCNYDCPNPQPYQPFTSYPTQPYTNPTTTYYPPYPTTTTNGASIIGIFTPIFLTILLLI